MGIEMQNRRDEIVEVTEVALALRSDFDQLIYMVLNLDPASTERLDDYALYLKEKWG
tara:strand:+ start:83 stop:253 length:171 start_codon:yes stop_codon:yes gene_type:complete